VHVATEKTADQVFRQGWCRCARKHGKHYKRRYPLHYFILPDALQCIAAAGL